MYVSSPVSRTRPHVPAIVSSAPGSRRRGSPCANGLRRNGENMPSSLPDVSIAHSPADQSPYVCGSARTPSRNASLSTPARWNMTDAACISSTGVLTVGAPARCATSASPVASITRSARIASRPAFDSTIDAGDRVAVDHRRDEQPVQHRVHAGLLDERVGDELEALGVDLVGERLAVGHGGAHRVRPLLELARDAARLDGPLVPVPREPLDPDGGEVAAEAAEALEQRHLGARAGGRERGRKAARAGADDEHAGAVDDVGLAGRLVDPHGSTIAQGSAAMRIAVRLGSGLSRLAGRSRLEVDLADGATVGDLLDRVAGDRPELGVRDAVRPDRGARHPGRGRPRAVRGRRGGAADPDRRRNHEGRARWRLRS